MNKALLPVLVSSIFMLSACNEEKNIELAAQLQHYQQQVDQLKTELENANNKLTQTQNELTAQQQAFPALKTTEEKIFTRNEEISFTENRPTGSGIINYYIDTVKTSIPWLDKLLISQAIDILNQDAEPKDKLTINDSDSDQQKAVLTEKLENNYQRDLDILTANKLPGIDYIIETSYLGQRENLVSFSLFRHAYYGGERSSFYTRYLNIDSETQSIIRLSDVIPPVKQKELKELLWNSYANALGNNKPYIKKQNFYIAKDFYFTPDGMNFVYSPSSIAPFSAGEITLQLYWNEINTLINGQYIWHDIK
ncbi:MULTISPECIES: RsiV family protein [Basfia]|uniref:DUF3298 domain-containing protein n=2 Tax=Basfia TaxID=697331 RepID=Q65SX2_MANSM|nr:MULTISPECIES: RsiV family protein [Basfia]AAU37938.1 unknown [[Mannheimia] succiniciproducens MBEL55E]QIM68656.1 hypothetical protein A4G13_04270 [Basfia succiniciproducens]SCX77789.1 Protein of unknown function [Basfia succiniciproducens]SEQ31932.1 Protein of unknown function [Basfia succiniciproducens]